MRHSCHHHDCVQKLCCSTAGTLCGSSFFASVLCSTSMHYLGRSSCLSQMPPLWYYAQNCSDPYVESMFSITWCRHWEWRNFKGDMRHRCPQNMIHVKFNQRSFKHRSKIDKKSFLGTIWVQESLNIDDIRFWVD